MPVARSVVFRAPRCGVSSGGGSGLSGAVSCRRRRTPGRSPAAASSAGRGLGERLAPALTPVGGLCRCAVGRFPGQRHHPHGCRRRLSPPDHPRTGAERPCSQQLARLPAPTAREPLARQWTARGVLLGLELSTILCTPPLGSGRFCVA